MEFLIADTFTDSLSKLTGEEQKAVKTTAFDLQTNPENPHISGQACYFAIYEIVLPYGSETATPLSRSAVPRYLAW